MNNEIIKQSWQNIKEHIRDNYGLSNISYKTWIEDLEIARINDHLVVIRIPSDNQFKLTYISKNYIDFFRVTISELLGEEYDVNFILNQEDEVPASKEPAPVKTADLSKIEDAHLNPKYRFDTFLYRRQQQHVRSLRVSCGFRITRKHLQSSVSLRRSGTWKDAPYALGGTLYSGTESQYESPVRYI